MKSYINCTKANKAGLFIIFISINVCLCVYLTNKFVNVYTAVNRPKIVIGIFSNDKNYCLRNAQRMMFISQARKYRSFDIKVVFLLDHPNPKLEEERRINDDMLYLNSTVQGWNNAFAWKLYVWYKIVAKTFPDTVLVGRMDDDVFCCTPQVFDRLMEFNDPFLYYGFRLSAGNVCPTNDCIDDMFLFVGIEIVRRITRGNFCDARQSEGCLRSKFPWKNLREWIQLSSNSTRVVHDNSKMIYFYSGPTSAKVRMETLYKKYKKDFCKKYILFHKASARYIYEMNKENGLQLGDFIRSKIAEENLMNANSCIWKQSY